MKAAGLVQSPHHGYLAITTRGSEELGGLKAEAGTVGNGRRKLGSPPKAQTGTATNGRRKPGRPKAQVKVPTNGRRKLGRPPKSQIVQQPSILAIKPDDKMIQGTTDIVKSYVEKNSVSANQIPWMIESIYSTLSYYIRIFQGIDSDKQRLGRLTPYPIPNPTPNNPFPEKATG